MQQSFLNVKYYQYIPTIVKVMQQNKSTIIFYRHDLYQLVIEHLGIPKTKIENHKINSGESQILNRINWAISYAKILGFIENPQRAYFKLTSLGQTLTNDDLAIDKIVNLVKQVAKKSRIARQNNSSVSENIKTENIKNNKQNNSSVSENIKTENIKNNKQNISSITIEESVENTNQQDALLWEESLKNSIYSMSSLNFEFFCLELVKSLGVKDAKHLGQTNDKGIDGEGLLVADHFLTYKVGFQFKRYNQDSKISSNAIREFRGSLSSYDKGVFITSSFFTKEAQIEAKKDTKITILDIEDILDLCTKSTLFLKKVETFELTDAIERYLD